MRNRFDHYKEKKGKEKNKIMYENTGGGGSHDGLMDRMKMNN
jgi:hypothetical protein